MKRLESQYVQAMPTRRPLKIFASDPMLGRAAGNRITIDVDYEPLEPGPQGSRVEVIDYDGAHARFYPPVDLDDRAILMQNGLEPTESDPRFHQQMVYAVAMRTLANFDRALGRTIHLRRTKYPRLRLLPHAFHGANAFYSRELHGILFGYFRADPSNPGPNLPGQTVYTCLSHDIIAHEMTHALVDRLRPYFLEPSNEDVLAFHEGFADIIALFQHFSFPEILRNEIQAARTQIRDGGLLVDLARQYGYATGAGKALRSAIGVPNARLNESVTEPHDRGSILVAAVFDAFFKTYQKRIRDLIRIATGGTGNLPDADLHPDLVNRVAAEASHTAQQMLFMCIRAFDYLPPVDITFGDYLRALVTADYELVPEDEIGMRSALIESFRQRGIFPENVISLAEESLLWENAEPDFPPIPLDTVEMLRELIFVASGFSRSMYTRTGRTEVQKLPAYRQQSLMVSEDGEEIAIAAEMARELSAYAKTYADRLSLVPSLSISVEGFHPVFRVAPNGRLLIELVVQFAQQDRGSRDRFGGIPLRGGTALVASADGTVRYVISKRLPTDEQNPRFLRQLAYLAACDRADPGLTYGQPDEFRTRMRRRMNLAALHQGAPA